jgi:hypothetical protein
MRIGEAHAFGSQSVHVRRLYFSLWIEAADIAVTEVIGQHIHKVRPFAGAICSDTEDWE